MGDTAAATVFHEGERAVQARAGVERIAAQVGRMLQGGIPGDFADFLSRRPFVIVAGQDEQGRMWASPIVGGIGFARALDERRVLLTAVPGADDPLATAFDRPAARIGILAIEADTRSRIRLNGVAERTPDGIVVTIAEAFGNCAKYIQRRVPVERLEPPATPPHRSSTRLDDDHAARLRSADTFYIASSHPERGADASHRGGRPGFVEVAADGASLRFPDYRGNRMFQTLGNLVVDPRAGLLVMDWGSGAALQISGRARIVWEEEVVGVRPGAERLVEVAIDAVHDRERAMPARWRLVEASPFNPPVR
jgi:predicted pyridoxine 5'-phosphate oxidase superfamily flavin-nucleotide-binding protein